MRSLVGAPPDKDFVNWPVNCFAEDVPHANIGRRGVVIWPRAAAARKHSRSRCRAAISRSRSRARASRAHSAGPPHNWPIKSGASFHAGGRGQRWQKIDDALADEHRLGPIEPADSDVAIANGVVAFDTAVGND